MLMSPVGFRSEKGFAGDDRQKLIITDTTSRQRGRPTSTNPKLLKNNPREWENLVAVPRWVPDTKTDWPTDCRS
jgi:hypothetical protein